MLEPGTFEDLITACECADTFFWKEEYNHVAYPDEIKLKSRDIQRHVFYSGDDIRSYLIQTGSFKRSYTDRSGSNWIIIDKSKLTKWFEGKSNYNLIDSDDPLYKFMLIFNMVFIKKFCNDENTPTKGVGLLSRIAEKYDSDWHTVLKGINQYRNRYYSRIKPDMSDAELIKTIGFGSSKNN